MVWYPILFFFNDTATTEIYTLSLHDALPICNTVLRSGVPCSPCFSRRCTNAVELECRSEEHTSELQSRLHLVCRLLLEKKNPQAAPRGPVGPIRGPSKYIDARQAPRRATGQV